MDQPVAVVERVSSIQFGKAPEGADARALSLLDGVDQRISAGDSLGAMQTLIDGLREIRAGLVADDWRALSAETILKHRLAETLFRCPLTRRSNEKPRGYAGDAELLDHIYGLGTAAAAPHPASIAGQIYFYTVNSPACRAVRERRDILAREIDAAARAAAGRGPEILSIACGHLREADLSVAIRTGGVGRFVALDQDDESLEVVARDYGRFGIEATKGTVRSIIARKSNFENLDLAYAAGLFDYLAEPIGMRLVERMFEFLRPGGRLVIANFTPAVPDVGYMETFMDWWLIFRTPSQMRRLLDGLPRNEVASIDIFEDSAGTIVYAAAEKRA